MKQYDVEPITSDDLQASVGMIIDSLQKYGGKGNNKYPNNDEGLKRFKDQTEAYFRHVLKVNDDRPEGTSRFYPSVEGWAVFLGVSRVMIFQYHKRSEEWQQYIDFVRNSIISVKTQLASNGKIPPLIYLFDMCNNGAHYYNTSEFHPPQYEPGRIRPQMTNEQIQQQILGALPDKKEGTEQHEIKSDINGSTQQSALYNFQPDQADPDQET